MNRSVLVGLAFAGLMGTAQADVLLSEDFNNVAALPGQGWVFDNQSDPPGPVATWFQGTPEIFPAHMGAPEAYIASNFNVAAPGGIIENWLITPEFSTEMNVEVSFYLRAEAFENFFDQLAFGFSSGSADLDAFTLADPIVVPTDGWTRFTVQLSAQGAGTTGRFAFVHTGNADDSNYVGLDTLRINSVPEPTTLMILGIGLAGAALVRRRRI
ncbi:MULTISPECIES: choice-of-anchor J family PEP-CTERM protein [unclassified Massilia]|uniref:choice-of-anchor J family PEP-CTERM protein n=1 Tax=unclassified Massilia TaxID=2609279 RepID=UPI001B832763|nr:MULTISPECIES: choice-of-anchor J domain-containing protein [unclassified Massilia]MBQ5940738.1 PEP-CTERM sorting domain-containing protein [Massilia sp. AB1]MBQ5963746.1 PEP-CTERM sorting domain-containing protein [Massilia sp. ZL223]